MENQVLSVSELTRRVKRTLEEHYNGLSVTGEISNFKHHSSGHRYFTLKDAGAQISCVLWKSRVVRFSPTDGMQVLASGRLTVWPPRGNYQLECSSLRPLGKGDLQLAFEALKQKLHAAGLFDAEHKKALPEFPERVGVITSETGAAVRDILTTLQRRMPMCEIVMHPAPVQGAEAAQAIAAAISRLDSAGCDLMIIGRGGGSIEDLWAFNTEEVAQALFAARTPVISAVGHEVDYTIADFIADVRAATPTAAAEIAVRDRRDIDAFLIGAREQLHTSIRHCVERRRDQLEHLEQHPGLRRLPEYISQTEMTLDRWQDQLNNAADRTLRRSGEQLAALTAHSQSLHPLGPLRRGFALLRSGGDLVDSTMTLRNCSDVEILRQNERALVGIQHVQTADTMADLTNEPE